MTFRSARTRPSCRDAGRTGSRPRHRSSRRARRSARCEAPHIAPPTRPPRGRAARVPRPRPAPTLGSIRAAPSGLPTLEVTREQRRSRADRGRIPRPAVHFGVPGAAQEVPRVRLPDDRLLPRLVLPLRPALDLRPRLHGPAGRQARHHRRAALRPGPVRHDLRDHDHLRPLGQQPARPAGRGRSPAQHRRRQRRRAKEN